MLDSFFDLPIINLMHPTLAAFILIVLAILLIILIIAVFNHPLYSRIAGIVVAIISLIVGLIISKDDPTTIVFGSAIDLAILYAFSYLFSMASQVFDTYWDGTYTLSISRDRIDFSKTISGGFIGNFFGSAFVSYLLSILALIVMPFLLWLVPIILALVNVVFLVEVIRG